MQAVEVECVTGKWIVNLEDEILSVLSPDGQLAHKSRGHLVAGSYIVSLLSQLEIARGERKALLEQISLRDNPADIESCYEGKEGYALVDKAEYEGLHKQLKELRDWKSKVQSLLAVSYPQETRTV